MFVELMPLFASRTVLITVAKVAGKPLPVNGIPAQAQARNNGALRPYMRATRCAQRTAELQTGDGRSKPARVASALIH